MSDNSDTDTDNDDRAKAAVPLIAVLLALTFFGGIIGLVIIGHTDPSDDGADGTVCGSGTTSLKPPANIAAAMNEAAKTSGLPAAWFTAIAKQETDFNPADFTGDSNGGTWGLFQLNREEWHSVYPQGDNPAGTPAGITDPTTHAHYAGIYFKKRLAGVQKLKKAHPDKPYAKLSDLDALVIAHNAGEGRLIEYPHIPTLTKQYLANIHHNFHPDGHTTCADQGHVTGDGTKDKEPFNAWMRAGGFTPGDRRRVPDPNQFYYGECTSYGAWAIRNHTKYKDFTNYWHGQHFSDAAHWATAAKAAGITVDQHPAVGAIAQSTTAARGTGHVAFITAVNPDGTFNISESNVVHKHTFGTRDHVKLGRDFTNILHFEK